jgi:molecular chaperone DnaK (HSP70)
LYSFFFFYEKVIATAFDLSLGGRDFDRIIMDAMRDDFKKRYKIDSYSTVKSKLRLRAECEKAKKTMSGNTQAIPISLDSFVDDKDVSGKISRADFEALAKPLLDRIRNTLINLLKEARKYKEK